MHISDKIDIWTKFLQDKNILNNRGQRDAIYETCGNIT